MTNEQIYDPQLALRQTIAGILDKPSVYMGGPSRQNLKRADEILAAIRADSRLLQAMSAHEPKAPRGFLGSTPDGGIDDADRVLEDAIPLMPDDVANKIMDLVLHEGLAYVLYKADEHPVVLARRDVENRGGSR